MRTAGRRKLDMVWIGLGAASTAGLVAIGSVLAKPERVERMWVAAELRGDGATTVSEVIDYDFGAGQERHGIFRTIPGLSASSVIQVASPDAPAGIADQTNTSVGGEAGVQVKIGDPNITISGAHRYLIRYDHPGLQGANGDLRWDAVGTGWEVDVEETDVHVVAPWTFVDPSCNKGRTGATGGCTVDQPEPGHLVIHIGSLPSGEGLTIFAGHGTDLPAAPALPDPPADGPPDDGAGVALPAAVGAVGALGAGLSTSRYTRRKGRERVGAGGAADAAWAGGGGPTGEMLLDSDELAQMATTDFAPPEGLTAPMGGIILAEQVTDDHKTAWLIEAAISGAIELDEPDKGDVRLTRKAPGSPEIRPILDTAFGGRSEMTLGKYDPVWAKGWSAIDTQLEGWSKTSGLWDPAGDKRKTKFRVLGVLALVVGEVAAVGGGAAAGIKGTALLPLVVLGALLAGAGWAAVIRSWELRIRTVQGSARWLRVESFRRFLAGSEAFHAEEAAKRGLLREYTAWAVAVGEIGRWSKACSRASIAPNTAGLGYVFLAPHLGSAASSASTAPSSSGGGGGGVGGGGGGGGGGSW